MVSQVNPWVPGKTSWEKWKSTGVMLAALPRKCQLLYKNMVSSTISPMYFTFFLMLILVYTRSACGFDDYALWYIQVSWFFLHIFFLHHDNTYWLFLLALIFRYNNKNTTRAMKYWHHNISCIVNCGGMFWSVWLVLEDMFHHYSF